MSEQTDVGRHVTKPSDQDLSPFGWAPGGYTFKCTVCGKSWDQLNETAHKRCRICRGCATDLWRKSLTEKPVKAAQEGPPASGEADEWRPIETLPHDGTEEDRALSGHWHGPVLVFIPDRFGGIQIVAQLDSGMWLVGDEERSFADLTIMPTHWRPLPDPPTPRSTPDAG